MNDNRKRLNPGFRFAKRGRRVKGNRRSHYYSRQKGLIERVGLLKQKLGALYYVLQLP